MNRPMPEASLMTTRRRRGRHLSNGDWVEVTRPLVHKRSIEEVLVKGWRPTSNGAHFALEIAGTHSMWSTDTPVLPLIVGLECVRQVGLVLGHVVGHVPEDWCFVLQCATLEWTGEAPAKDPARALGVEAICDITHARERDGVLVEIRSAITLNVDGSVVARGNGHIRCLPPRAYAALRRRAVSTSRTASPPGTGYLVQAVKEDETTRALVGWEYPHPFFFDHDVDHVPGMVLAHAALEMHRLTHDRGVPATGIALECERFAEFASPVVIVGQSGSTGVRFLQQNRDIAAARVWAREPGWRHS